MILFIFGSLIVKRFAHDFLLNIVFSLQVKALTLVYICCSIVTKPPELINVFLMDSTVTYFMKQGDAILITIMYGTKAIINTCKTPSKFEISLLPTLRPGENA